MMVLLGRAVRYQVREKQMVASIGHHGIIRAFV